MALIPLTQDLSSLVSEEDADWLRQFRWHAVKFGTKARPLVYAARNAKIDGAWKLLLMHRALLGAPRGFVVDHINHDGLDNRRVNLRLCTQRENMKNARSGSNKTGFRGVSRTSPNRFTACIHANGRSKYLGCFETPEAAAAAYDAAATEQFGEFAQPNFPTTFARIGQEQAPG